MLKTPAVDRRILKTRNALRMALLRLLDERPFEQISIALLASEAGITRATFYQHYASVEELFAAIVDELCERLDARIDDADLQFPIDNSRIIRHVLTVWAEEVGEISILVEQGLRRVVVERFEASLTRMLERVIRVNGLPSLHERELAYITNFLANAAISIFNTWARRGYKERPDQLERIVATIIGPGIEQLLRDSARPS